MSARCVSRRSLLAGGGVAGRVAGDRHRRRRASCPRDMVPLIGPGYRPVDADERGLWQQMERVEEEIAGLQPADQGSRADRPICSDLIGKVGGPAAQGHAHLSGAHPRFQRGDVPDRLHGDLLRPAAADAQRGAAGRRHRPRSGHFLRKHQIRQWRDMRRKTDIFSILAMGAGVAGGAAGVYTGDLAQLAQLGTILSLLRYNRALEAEADAMGARLLAENGYPPDRDGQHLGAVDRRGEIVGARYRRKRRRPRHFACSRPTRRPKRGWPTCRLSAREVTVPGRRLRQRPRPLSRGDRAPSARCCSTTRSSSTTRAPASIIINTLARTAGTACCASTRRRSGACATAPATMLRAAQGYAAAVGYPDAPADAWRWHGLMLIKAGPPRRRRAPRWRAIWR